LKTLADVLLAVGRIERAELVRWIELGWVVPSRSMAERAEREELLFSELDIARISMICDLRQDMMVDEETMPLVLSLLDQMYALRRRMKALTGAIQRQPEDVRTAILEQVRASRDGSPDRG
jgi:chaperone modulatory protein CbpM